MTKKHFIALADTWRSGLQRGTLRWGLTEEESRGYDLGKESALDTICEFCRSQNHAFMEDRFRAYINGECGPSGGKL
jgi:hypothetical protein